MASTALQDPAPKWTAILDVQDPDGTRTRHPFRHPRMALGRQRDNDLSLADEGVSHRHCEFVSEHGWFVVRDLGSQNGTWVNGWRVGEARLRDGDEIRVGGTRITVSLAGRVRHPDRRSHWRLLAFALGLAAVAVIWWGMSQHEVELRGRYVAALRQHLGADPCAAPQLGELVALEGRTAGRSFAIALDKGAVKLSRADAEADLQLLALYRKKLGLLEAMLPALLAAQQGQRESAERIVRLGQRFASGKDRRLAAWAQGLLDDRARAADDLAQGVETLRAETQKLAGLVDAVVTRREAPLAPALAQFQFSSSLPRLLAACRAAASRADTAVGGALTALEE